MRKFFFGRTIVFLVLLIVVGGFFLFNRFIYHEKQGNEMPAEPYRATLAGTYVCLPFAEDRGATTEEDCEPGIQTEVGEYYAVNFFLMSQMHAPLEVGQQFSASGVITPIERLSTDHWKQYIVEGIFSVTDSVSVVGEDEEAVLCTADVKQCPDGSYVGRHGKQCEFDPCPSEGATSTSVTIGLGESASAMGVTLLAQDVVSDSRCATGVQCVWAGTVEVRTILTTPVAHGAHVLALGQAQVFGDHTVTLVEVSPMKTQEDITPSAYQFTYAVN